MIATPLGSVPEIVQDGLNGLIVPDAEAAAERLPDVLKLDRAACRRHTEQHFSLDSMIDGYLSVYQQVLAERG